jgi:glycosyltransferase involved in cell wall biosynthesis
MESIQKYSVIIPTLWKSDRTDQLIKDLSESEFVDEIIIIDNASIYEMDRTIEKVRIVSRGENIYVSPAWNMGVELARNEYIAICNDDINFNPNIFGLFLANEVEGIVGQASDNYNKSYDIIPGLGKLEGIRPWGWGSLLLTQKKYWIPIPEELKVWYNDDFMTEINPCSKWVLHNFTILTEMSTTSDLPEFNLIKENDRIEWEKIKNKQ